MDLVVKKTTLSGDSSDSTLEKKNEKTKDIIDYLAQQSCLFFVDWDFAMDEKWEFYESTLRIVAENKGNGSRKEMAYHLYLDKLTEKLFEHHIEMTNISSANNSDKFKSMHEIQRDNLRQKYFLTDTSLIIQRSFHYIAYQMDKMKRMINKSTIYGNGAYAKDVLLKIVYKCIKVVKKTMPFVLALDRNFEKLRGIGHPVADYVIDDKQNLTVGKELVWYYFTAHFLDVALMIFDDFKIYKAENLVYDHDFWNDLESGLTFKMGDKGLMDRVLREAIDRHPEIFREIGCGQAFGTKLGQKYIVAHYSEKMHQESFLQKFRRFIEFITNLIQ
jgi:hypothetical protein